MRFEMARHLGSFEKSLKSSTRTRVLAGGSESSEPPAEFSWTDFLSYLLYIDAAIEHGLMIQYLYAAYSLGGPLVPEKHRPMIRGWQEVILGIAKEEMGHLISVQNVLKLIGAPLSFGREDFPWDSGFYPFPFSLEPLTLNSLARYVYAESPADWSGPDAVEVLKLVKATVASPHQVSVLFAKILEIIKDPDRIPDDVFQAESWPYQANWDQWGRGYQGGNRGNATGANPPNVPNLLVNPVATRDQAVNSLSAIAEQGEVPASDSMRDPSHFARFLKIFHEMKALEPEFKKGKWAPARNVAHNPYVPSEDDRPPTTQCSGVNREPITNSQAKCWAQLSNVRYRMLLNYLSHGYDLSSGNIDTGSTDPLATLINATFGEMYNLRALAMILVETPLAKKSDDRFAGPPFQMPYTLNRPAGEFSRWRMHRELLIAADALITQALELSPPNRHRYLNSLREADKDLLRLIDAILHGNATKAY